MIETGRIESIADNVVQIRPKETDACFGCLNYECKKNRGLIRALNTFNLPIQIGQWVTAEVSNRSAIMQAVIALGPVLFGFIAGYFISGTGFLPIEDPLSEGARAACGVAGLFAAAFIVYGIRRKFPPREIVRIVNIIDIYKE